MKHRKIQVLNQNCELHTLIHPLRWLCLHIPPCSGQLLVLVALLVPQFWIHLNEWIQWSSDTFFQPIHLNSNKILTKNGHLNIQIPKSFWTPRNHDLGLPILHFLTPTKQLFICDVILWWLKNVICFKFAHWASSCWANWKQIQARLSITREKYCFFERLICWWGHLNK